MQGARHGFYVNLVLLIFSFMLYLELRLFLVINEWALC
jgi:hypothetical protein